MGWRKEDYLDLTDLEKRGLIKFNQLKESVAEIPMENGESTFDNFFNQQETGESSSFDSLAGLAGAGSANSFSEPNKDIQHLKVKIEDLEYKLDRLMDKIVELERKN